MLLKALAKIQAIAAASGSRNGIPTRCTRRPETCRGHLPVVVAGADTGFLESVIPSLLLPCFTE